MILTPEQEAMEKMQKELAEKEEAMRQMQLEAEKARAQAQPKETPKVSNPSQRLLPNVNPEGQSAGHMVYNGANYIVPQPFVMQFPTSQVANPDNEALKKEIQELKAEVNKYNEQLAVQIHEAKVIVSMLPNNIERSPYGGRGKKQSRD